MAVTKFRRHPLHHDHRLAPAQRSAGRYRDLGPDFYAKHADAGRKVRGHIRQLEALGLDVTVTPRQAAA